METKIFDPILPPIHLACVNDDMRFNMRLIRIENACAYCTNASMIAVADLNIATNFTPDMIKILNGKTIHMDAWKEMCKSSMIDICEEQILISINGVDKAIFYTQSQGEFFKINELLQDTKKAYSEKTDCVAFDPKLIQIASKIFREDNMVFSFSPSNKGHIVFPNDYNGLYCLIMPKLYEGAPRYMFTW